MENLTAESRQIFDAEQQVIDAQSRLNALRTETIRGQEITDYDLTNWSGKREKLSELFGDKDQLILIHNMGVDCAYCTMWADGFTGLLPYLERMAAFVIVSPDDVETQKQGATNRGWKFKMLSAKGTSLFKDMGFEESNGSPWPGVSTLYKDSAGKLRRHSMASFGPGDMFCPVFSFQEILPHKREPLG